VTPGDSERLVPTVLRVCKAVRSSTLWRSPTCSQRPMYVDILQRLLSSPSLGLLLSSLLSFFPPVTPSVRFRQGQSDGNSGFRDWEAKAAKHAYLHVCVWFFSAIFSYSICLCDSACVPNRDVSVCCSAATPQHEYVYVMLLHSTSLPVSGELFGCEFSRRCLVSAHPSICQILSVQLLASVTNKFLDTISSITSVVDEEDVPSYSPGI
jgi:hypothetical protein